MITIPWIAQNTVSTDFMLGFMHIFLITHFHTVFNQMYHE